MRFGVLVSGSGTNLQALLDARSRGELDPAQLVGVISNRPDVQALERAKRAEVPTRLIDHKSFDSRPGFEVALAEALDAWNGDALILAGFMRVLTADFVARYPHRIINTHPALCPAFPGIRAPQQAIDAGVKVSGCTVHFVDAGVDTGPIIFQAAVEVRDSDDAGSLHRRIQAHEHRLLPQAARLLAADRLRVDGPRVRIAPS